MPSSLTFAPDGVLVTGTRSGPGETMLAQPTLHPQLQNSARATRILPISPSHSLVRAGRNFPARQERERNRRAAKQAAIGARGIARVRTPVRSGQHGGGRLTGIPRVAELFSRRARPDLEAG